MNSGANRFDPWGPISSVLYELNDSDFVQNAIASTGAEIAWDPLTKAESYSHGTRIRALRRDISAAYAQFDVENRGLFAQIIVKYMLQRRESDRSTLRDKIRDRLSDIGWTISDDGVLSTHDALIGERFFPANSEYDAYVAIRDLFASAKSEILIEDPYIGSSILMTLGALQLPNLSVKILTIGKNIKKDFATELSAFNKQFPHLVFEIRATNGFHDRFVVIDREQFYHIGASIKDAGNRAFMISRIQDRINIENLQKGIASAWDSGAPLFK